jgi:hypothetical protein
VIIFFYQTCWATQHQSIINQIDRQNQSSINNQGREDATNKLEDQKIREAHERARAEMLVKYFSEKVGPAVHDVAMKKEVIILIM